MHAAPATCRVHILTVHLIQALPPSRRYPLAGLCALGQGSVWLRGKHMLTQHPHATVRTQPLLAVAFGLPCHPHGQYAALAANRVVWVTSVGGWGGGGWSRCEAGETQRGAIRVPHARRAPFDGISFGSAPRRSVTEALPGSRPQ